MNKSEFPSPLIDSNLTQSTGSDSHSPLTPCPIPKLPHRQRLSEPDPNIINRAMSLRRKKTLMCSEQSNFQILSKVKLPQKKYGAICPTEFQKFMIKNLNIHTYNTTEVKYRYPDQPSAQPNKKRGKSIACLLF